ncbi:hypothetical protein Rsub_09607 [Raphidocelis subcapitata]|uniref:UspA domain-containing protein n=1 Tax=Raphidocelis subcapitata TaxID=307507 RepID=A0A2V0PA73_9CHLO|nr:hypothetical protein Rsub_09607 [Raphidocelis subcapitata]|eukprot:GBF96751.1 hypothetical protein Rsub_09607 [Raphidocelis subcapitata]
MQRKQSLSHMISRRGARVLLLAVDNHVVTVVSSEDSRPYGDSILRPFAVAPLPSGAFPTPVVLVKGDERLGDVIAAYAAEARADLVVCGSHHLCVTGARDDPLPAAGSFALRLARTVRCCPLLVVKSNNNGHYLASGSAATGLRIMVDCQSNTRHLLDWLMDRLDPDKDGLYLAVSKALDQAGSLVKETARRMLTNFSVQASAARADAIDVIALTAPTSKSLPQSIIDVLKEARTSVLIFNPPGGAGGTQLTLGAALAAVAEGGGGGGAAEAAGAAAADDLAALA